MAGLLERLKAAASFANTSRQIAMGTFSTDDAKHAYGLLQGIYPASRGEPPPRGTQERLEGYNQMPWLRTCAECVADAIASVQWQLFVQKKGGTVVRNRIYQRGNFATRQMVKAELEDRNELVEIEAHPFLDLVIDKGNSFLTGQSTRKVTQLHLDLAGEAFWLKQRATTGLLRGVVTAVWPIPPHWILGTPTPTHKFFRVGFRAWIGDIPESELLWMANPDPKFPYGRGSGLGGALADELETDEYASRFLKQYFYNDATPPFVVSPKGTDTTSVWNETEARRFEYAWVSKLQGYWKAHKPIFANRALDIKEFKRDLRSMQMVQLREHERDVVMQVFRIPPEIFGVLQHSNRATIDSADFIFTTKCQIPRLDFLRAQLQEKMLPEYDDRQLLILDYVSPVQEDKAQQLDAAKAAPYALTVNEWRRRMGEAETDGGEVRFVPFNLTLTPDLSVPPPKPAEPQLGEHPSEVVPPTEPAPKKEPEVKAADVIALIDAALAKDRDRQPFTVNAQPTINLPQPADIIVNVAPTPPAVVHIDAPPPAAVHVDVAAPTVHVAAAQAPDVTVNVPEQKAPIVNVAAPEVHVQAPSVPPTTKTVTKRVERDSYDRITRIVEEHAETPTDPPVVDPDDTDEPE